MFGGRKHRINQLELKAITPNEKAEVIRYYVDKVDLSKDILKQMQGVDKSVVSQVIKTAGNSRCDKYQSLLQKRTADLTDDELLYLIQGDTKALSKTELQFIQDYEAEQRKWLSGLSERELIEMVTRTR
ncbi:hypothetical protein ACLHDG_07640 [Sulfurovum sp. CS9]|uniref:hypothetical protein n=1 Tax=Sulfurovum sp. CS9 TaxID=3391146 RepID=UPI0039EB6838